MVIPSAIETKPFVGVDRSITIKLSPRQREKDTAKKLKKRVKRLLKKNENKVCMDCSKPNPKWASLLCVPPVQGGLQSPNTETYYVGGFCCLECSGAHRRLGTHISFVRSIDLDTLKDSEVKALELGGNDIVNGIFEGRLVKNSKQEDDAVKVGYLRGAKPNQTSNQKEREAYIRQKYEKRKFLNLKNLAKLRQSIINRDIKNQGPLSLKSPLSDNVSPSSAGSAAGSPLQQLQIFTSSPRTLALIEKYMKPKVKKKSRRRMKISFKRFSRKRYFKGDIRNLRGLVGANPNLNVVETRSDGCPSPSSDLDGFDDESVLSTRSTMSAAIRRRLINGKKILTPTKSGFSKIATSPTKGYPSPSPARKQKTSSKRQPRTPSSKGSNHTPKSRKKFFGKKKNKPLADCVNEDDGELNSKEEMFSPASAASSTDSQLRSRLGNLLVRTPKRRNSDKNASGKKKKNANRFFFPDEPVPQQLGIVEEDTGTNEASDCESLEDEISAMKAWSKRLDKVIARVFKKKKTPKTGGSADEVTLLQENSNEM